jgi:hypothetical protein
MIQEMFVYLEDLLFLFAPKSFCSAGNLKWDDDCFE